ncbi:MAG: hypothetical protein ACYCX3_11160 [Thermoleophilia bacterium]
MTWKGEAAKDRGGGLSAPYYSFPEYDFHVKAACSTCQGLTAFTMSKLKALDEYDKNAGVHVVLGRHKDTPEELPDGQDVFLMGDCTKTLKKRLEAPDEHEKLRVQIRKRLEYEEILFTEWMATQGRS